jgi:hypothetical protein
MAKKKRKIQGRDWHGWAWKAGHTWHRPGELFYFATPTKPSRQACDYGPPTETGKWVRVKFVEV